MAITNDPDVLTNDPLFDTNGRPLLVSAPPAVIVEGSTGVLIHEFTASGKIRMLPDYGYETTVFDDRPTAFWRLSDHSVGQGMRDHSGNQLHGSWFGASEFNQGNMLPSDVGQCVRLDGTTAYGMVLDNSLLDLVDKFTLEAWVSKTALSSQRRILNKSQVGSGTTDTWGLSVNTSGEIVFEKVNTTTVTTTDAGIVAGNLYHVMVTYDSSASPTTKIYLNGRLLTLSGGPITGTFTANAHPVLVGRRGATSSSYWDGLLSNVAMYDHVLPQSRAQAHFNAGMGNTPRTDTRPRYDAMILREGPLAYYELDETSGTVANDSSPYKRHGTYVNTPTLGQPSIIEPTYGKSVLFDGASAEGVDTGVRFHQLGILDHDFTLEAWVIPANNTDTGRVIVGRQGQTSGIFQQGSQWRFRMMMIGDASTYDIDGGTVTAGSRSYLVATYRSSDKFMELWVDGVLVGTQVFDETGMGFTNSRVWIGREQSAVGGEFSGRISNVAIYDVILTQAQIEEHYYTGSGPRTSYRLMDSYEDTLEPAGGFVSATAIIPEVELMDFPDNYKLGTVWKVFDPNWPGYIWDGDIEIPAIYGGASQVVGRGVGDLSDTLIDRFLLQTRNLDLWVPGDNEPLKYPSDERITAEVREDTMVFGIPKNAEFKKDRNDGPSDWKTGLYFWIPNVDFNPRDLGGVASWFLADAIRGKPSFFKNDNVRRWGDMSGKKRPATIKFGSNAPKLVRRELNGHDTVRFDGTSFLRLNELTIPQPVTIFSVARLDSAAADATIIGGQTNSQSMSFGARIKIGRAHV